MVKFENGKTPLSAETFNKMQKDLLEIMFPIGSRYTTQKNQNPSEILEFGIWERFNGKVALGLDETEEDFDTIGKAGGEKEHILTINELAGHRHIGMYNNSNNWSSSVNEDSSGTTIGYQSTIGPIQGSENTMMTGVAGESQPHNNMQPYEIVGYMWIRRG